MDESDVDEQLDRLLALEVAGALPDTLAFWRHEASADRPGPWVLSQWWPCRFEVEGVEYRSAEAFLMAEKARLFDDGDARQRILAAEHPSLAQRAGREVQGFDEATWVRHRLGIAVAGNLAKFSQDAGLRAYLTSTTPKLLVEASPRDRIWGVGLVAGDDRVRRPSEWLGRNLLGFALQEVRRLLAPVGDDGR